MIDNAGLWGGFALATIATVCLFRTRSAVQSMLHWPHVVARVAPESIVFRRAGWSLAGKKKGLFIPEVLFEYECQGQSYQGRKMLPVGWTIRESEKDRVGRELATFAVALCNPSDPADAYLDIPDRYQRGSISWITVGLIVSGLFAVVLGIMLLARAI